MTSTPHGAMSWPGPRCPLLERLAFSYWRPCIGTLEDALALVFILLAAWRALVGLRGDLVERRRRLRPVLAIVAWSLYAGGVLLHAHAQPWSAHVRLEARSSRAAGAGGAYGGFRAACAPRGGVLFLRHRLANSDGSGPNETPEPTAAIYAQDDALLTRLRKLMEAEKVYRHEGFGAPALVAALGVPEYRMRRLINQRLGHRNFSSFVNGYRLAEVTAALADPGQANVPILTIALDAGFQSIGPFNRAFKAHTGMTPTAYRKQADSRTAMPI